MVAQLQRAADLKAGDKKFDIVSHVQSTISAVLLSRSPGITAVLSLWYITARWVQTLLRMGDSSEYFNQNVHKFYNERKQATGWRDRTVSKAFV